MAASSLTALGPSKFFFPKNYQTLKWPDAEKIARRWKKPDAEKIARALIPKNFSALPLDAGDFLSSLFQCLVLSPRAARCLLLLLTWQSAEHGAVEPQNGMSFPHSVSPLPSVHRPNIPVKK
jgi:hypothetical protein